MNHREHNINIGQYAIPTTSERQRVISNRSAAYVDVMRVVVTADGRFRRRLCTKTYPIAFSDHCPVDSGLACANTLLWSHHVVSSRGRLLYSTTAVGAFPCAVDAHRNNSMRAR